MKYGFNILWSEEDEGFIATCPDFPGLMAFGETYEIAAKEATGVLDMFIESYKERGKPLPQATVINEFSGQIRLRLPKSLHRELSKMAEREEVSLNTYIIQLLSSRNAIKEFSKEVLEQVKGLHREAMMDLITGSVKNMRGSTRTLYNPEVKRYVYN